MQGTGTSGVEVSDIFGLFGEPYRQSHKLPIQQRRVMFAIEHCRTSVLGGHVDGCDSCGHKRISYNSCRNRHCPKCQGLNRIKWVDKLSSGLLPIRYFHIVFTIPSELNRLALVNQKCMYDILFKAASESLLQLARDPKYLNAESGLVAVLHTWGQNLMEHPHLHTIVPAGGWDETAQYWKSSRKNYFIPVKVISAVFRGKFLAFLKQAYSREELKFEGATEQYQFKNNFKQLIDILYSKPWVVYAKKPFKNAGHIVAYLGRYTHRVAIGNNRIVGIEDGHVLFKWKDYKEHSKSSQMRGSPAKPGQKIMKLVATEFIRRFLLHVLPKGFCKIRYFGILASRNRNTVLTRCRKALGIRMRKSRFEGLSWQQALKLISGIDVTLCPVCKKGTMIQLAVIKGYRGPPSFIKCIPVH